MKRKRIGKKQRELLAILELLGPIQWVDLDQNGRRGAHSLARQGLARIIRRRVGPVAAPGEPQESMAIRVEYVDL